MPAIKESEKNLRVLEKEARAPAAHGARRFGAAEGTRQMRAVPGRGWWVQTLRGSLAVLFGVVTFIWPDLTLAVAVPLFAAFTLMDGAFALLGTLHAAEWRLRWWPLLLLAIVDLAVGILVFLRPRMTLFPFLSVVGVWAGLTGVFELLAARELRRVTGGIWLLEVRGAASVLFGVLLVVFPGAEALPILWMICAFLIVFGMLLIVASLELRRWQRHALPRMTGCAGPSGCPGPLVGILSGLSQSISLGGLHVPRSDAGGDALRGPLWLPSASAAAGPLAEGGVIRYILLPAPVGPAHSER